MEIDKRKVSFKRQGRTIVDPKVQMKYINGVGNKENKIPSFNDKLKEHGQFPLTVSKLETLQVNIGYMCNQTCEHCHVDAGPDRKEIMSKETMIECLKIVKSAKIDVVDITGGAPEMNPEFKWFIKEINLLGVKDVIVRSNLTIVLANKKFNDLPDFFKKNKLHIISSLPCILLIIQINKEGKGFLRSPFRYLNN